MPEISRRNLIRGAAVVGVYTGVVSTGAAGSVTVGAGFEGGAL